MDPNLMRPASFDVDANKTEPTIGPNSERPGKRSPAIRYNGHAQSVQGVPTNRPIKAKAVSGVRQGTYTDREVGLEDLALSERIRQGRLRLWGLCHDDCAAGALVQPMHDPRTQCPRVLAKPASRGAKVVKESVHQGPVPVPRCRVHHHPWFLVHDKHGLILEEDVQIQGLGSQSQLVVDLEADGHLLGCPDPVTLLQYPSIRGPPNTAPRAQRAKVAPRLIWHLARKELVESLPSAPLLDHEDLGGRPHRVFLRRT
mmetsp:Transcript_3306/g.9607  ORF Transcript_3306/g.9607 Transcript_3306/m.9607 type:complete len:257 (-) Transcript_3306:66-836(-)